MGWWLFSAKSVCGTSISSSSCCCKTKKEGQTKKNHHTTSDPRRSKPNEIPKIQAQNASKLKQIPLDQIKTTTPRRNPHHSPATHKTHTHTHTKRQSNWPQTHHLPKIKQKNKTKSRKKKSRSKIGKSQSDWTTKQRSKSGKSRIVRYGRERTSMGAGVITVMAIIAIDLRAALLIQKQWRREKDERERALWCMKTRSPEAMYAIARDERQGEMSLVFIWGFGHFRYFTLQSYTQFVFVVVFLLRWWMDHDCMGRKLYNFCNL